MGEGNSKGAKSLWKEQDFVGNQDIGVSYTNVFGEEIRFCRNYNQYAAIDVERNELMRVYPSRNYLTTKLLVVPKYCENKPKFIVDKDSLVDYFLESLGLEY